MPNANTNAHDLEPIHDPTCEDCGHPDTSPEHWDSCIGDLATCPRPDAIAHAVQLLQRIAKAGFHDLAESVSSSCQDNDAIAIAFNAMCTLLQGHLGEDWMSHPTYVSAYVAGATDLGADL